MVDPPLPPILGEAFLGSFRWEGSWNRLTGVYFRVQMYFSVVRLFDLLWSLLLGNLYAIRGEILNHLDSVSLGFEKCT